MAIKNVRINIAAQGTYPTAPQLDVGQIGSTMSVINESLTNDVYFSLDGVNDAFHAVPSVVVGAVFNGKYTKLWARVGTTSMSAVNVQLIAEN